MAALLAIAAATVAAAVSYRLGFGLTLDEPFMANAARLPWQQLWRQILPIDNLPFGYVALKTWTDVFGESELALRSLSSIAYGVAVLFTGLAARRAGGNAAGLIAATLAATSDRMGLEYAAMGRTYALVSMIAAAAVWQTLRILQRGDRAFRLSAAGLFVTHLLGVFSHPGYLFVALAFGSVSAVVDRSIRSVPVVAAVAAVMTYVITWWPMLRQTMALKTTFWMTNASLGDVQRAYTLLWGVGPGFILAGAVTVALLKDPSNTARALRREGISWLILAAAFAWILPIAASQWKPVFQWDRSPMMLLPVTCAALGVMLTSCAGTAAGTALAIICAGAAAYRIIERPRADPSPSRAVISNLLARTTCGDTVIAAGVAATTAEYYFRTLHAPPCVRLLAFPSDEWDAFANWSGRLRDPAALARLSAEAARTAKSAASSGHAVWVIGPMTWETREATAMMERALATVADCGPPAPMNGAFIDTLRECVPRHKT